MQERYTKQAENVLALAKQAASSCGHSYIGTEHLLVGLVEENIGRYSLELLKCLGATLLIAAGDYDLGALLQERLRGGQANARGATSDNRRLALDFKHEFLPTDVH